MAENLPEPACREESYLAKAAGMDVTIPDKPESRIEQYLDAIAEGGGGGGGSYSAGTGIDITNNTISVDTDTIQEKLTAGTGIDITDNTISATGGGGPTVVQTTGDSTTDVMSQNATTSMVYHDTTKTCVQIGLDASATRTSTNAQIAIGKGATASGSGYNIVIGNNASASAATKAIAIGGTTGTRDNCINIGGAIRNTGGNYNVAIGGDTGGSSHAYCVALGHGSACTRTGEVNIGAGGTHGYNSTEYRVLGGVHDPVDTHDAATKGYVDQTITTLYIDTDNFPSDPEVPITGQYFYKEKELLNAYSHSEVKDRIMNGNVRLCVVDGYNLNFYNFSFLSCPTNSLAIYLQLQDIGNSSVIDIVANTNTQDEFDLSVNPV